MADSALDSDADPLMIANQGPERGNIDLDEEHQHQQRPLIQPDPSLSDHDRDDPELSDAHASNLRELDTAPPNCACSAWHRLISRMDRLDKKLSGYVFRASPGKFADVAIAVPCLAFSYFGFPLWIVLYVVIMQSYLYALCVLVSIVVTQIMKRCFKRPRPRLSDLGARWFYLQFEDVSAEHSFPSGDTAQAAVFSVTLGYSIDEYYWLGMACVVPFVALGRVYFGRHYIGDTVGGALTGAAIGWLMNQFLVHHMYRLENYV